MKIIQVEPIPKYFSITWMLGSRCNYDCMYCPTELHDNTSSPHTLEKMQQTWINIYSKTKHNNLLYKISFTGGEVTANKNFLPLVKWLRTNYTDVKMILLTTNGSASKNYYTKLSQYVEAISFSTHSEFINEQEFFNKVEAINHIMVPPEKSVHVNIMDEYWNQEQNELYKTWLTTRNINYTINKINYERGTRTNFLRKGTYNLVIN